RIPAQVDVGFGDSITPKARRVKWPMPLDFASVPLQVYCAETSIAEKLHAAVILDSANSRMKDFFDIYWLSNHQKFESTRLHGAIQATFKRRDTQVPVETPLAYTNTFASSPDKQIQWRAFLKKSRLEPLEFTQTIERISQFLSPLLTGAARDKTWTPETGWKPKESSS
ncbi:MAG: nucleotidyl transferase AbiEii/AbiGii toxin family protein, partial [Verrucomicrobia bacterium]|nr:nucleotidyl transferase AbiEii/AbiGii toxin family protein [Verrucomicrobiota bacterium]